MKLNLNDLEMQKTGVRDTTIKLMNSYLMARKGKVRIGEGSIQVPVITVGTNKRLRALVSMQMTA